eukprot:TRINITY_DN67421_c2_g1_i1.p1 TRINITY_DN67421_c2_g1~~TRINITY_DN67421_c2_g1_i1.p1  ORF type:complete len:330 (-),score=157.95 TRINITY_DN67421_c2_g1_i1:315-1304(-)
MDEAQLNAVSGVGAGVASLAVVYPLENLTTVMQANKDSSDGKTKSTWAHVAKLFRDGEIWSVYKGFSSGLFAYSSSMACFFYVHVHAKAIVAKLLGLTVEQMGPVHHLLAGWAAGTATCVIVNPLWLVNTRQKMGKYRSLLHGLMSIVREEGFTGLFTGIRSNMFGPTLNSGIQFMVYETLRALIVKMRKGNDPSAVEFLVLGALAKLVATVATYPASTVTTRLQTQNIDKDKKNKTKKNSQVQPESSSTSKKNKKKPQQPRKKFTGPLDCARFILKNEGVGGFFVGLDGRLAQYAIQNAIRMAVLESISSTIKTRLPFLVAASSASSE